MNTARFRPLSVVLLLALFVPAGIGRADEGGEVEKAPVPAGPDGPVAPGPEEAPPGIEKLIEDLGSEDPFVRLVAAKKLAELGPAAAAALPALKNAAEDPDPDVAAVAKAALGKIQLSPEVTKLLADLSSEEALVRLMAVRRLGEMGPAAKAAIPALTAALSDPDADVRAVAAAALKKIEKRPEVMKLIEELKDENPLVRLVAAKALGEIDPPATEAAPALEEATRDTDPDVRRVAMRSLKAIAGAAGGALAEPGKKPGVATEKLRVKDVFRIFDPGGEQLIGRPPGMGFFLEIANGTAQPVVVTRLHVAFRENDTEVDSAIVSGPPQPILSGKEIHHEFFVEWEKPGPVQPGSRWSRRSVPEVTILDATPAELTGAEENRLLRLEAEREKVVVRYPQPVSTMGGVGCVLSLQNNNPGTSHHVLVRLLGYAAEGRLVQAALLDIPTLAKGYTRIDTSPRAATPGRPRIANLAAAYQAGDEAVVHHYVAEVVAVQGRID